MNDLIDDVIERWGGQLITGLGLIAIGVSIGGYYRILPAPLSAPIFPENCIGCRRLTFVSMVLLYGGFVLVLVGVRIWQHFRDERIME
jgi:hypothetical protein